MGGTLPDWSDQLNSAHQSWLSGLEMDMIELVFSGLLIGEDDLKKEQRIVNIDMMRIEKKYIKVEEGSQTLARKEPSLKE